jgi:hypothetical protein
MHHLNLCVGVVELFSEFVFDATWIKKGSPAADEIEMALGMKENLY